MSSDIQAFALTYGIELRSLVTTYDLAVGVFINTFFLLSRIL